MKYRYVFCSVECDRTYFKAILGSACNVPEKYEEIENRFDILDL